MEDIKEETLLKKEFTIPNEFICPISLQLMLDPVIATDGHTYEKTEIIKVKISPMTRQNIGNNLIPNLSIKSLIDKLLIEHPELKDEQYKLVCVEKYKCTRAEEINVLNEFYQSIINIISIETAILPSIVEVAYLHHNKSYANTVSYLNLMIQTIISEFYISKDFAITYFNQSNGDLAYIRYLLFENKVPRYLPFDNTNGKLFNVINKMIWGYDHPFSKNGDNNCIVGDIVYYKNENRIGIVKSRFLDILKIMIPLANGDIIYKITSQKNCYYKNKVILTS